MAYHYGKTIREYRMLAGLTLSQLAEKWPSKEAGVTLRYVSDIERGVKHIQDLAVLRDLAHLLKIPLWKLGLSEYNPFEETAQALTKAVLPDLFLLDSFVQQLSIIKAANGTILDAHVSSINTYLSEIVEHHPSSLSDKKLMRIYAQALRLNAIRAYDNTAYTKAIALFMKMIDIAERSTDLESITLAYMGTGVELMRQERYQEAEAYLLKARDCSLSADVPKVITTLVHGMLVRYYASTGDTYQFEKQSNLVTHFCSGLHAGINKSMYVFHNPSQTLEEISNGYILLHNGKKALAILPEIEKQVQKDQNIPLDRWMPLDYAQALLCLHEIEESIKYLGTFYERTAPISTPHIRSKIRDHLCEISAKGYGDLQVVRDFQEMLREMK
jgi:transcriptional regulator with XRE-family HTH domain